MYDAAEKDDKDCLLGVEDIVTTAACKLALLGRERDQKAIIYWSLSFCGKKYFYLP